MKLTVSVEIEVSTMPEDAAREIARAQVEARGLTVTRVALNKAPADTGKAFTPKRGAAGSLLIVQGRGYVIWADAPSGKWATPAEPREGDAPVYLIDAPGRNADPFHLNGRPHRAYGCAYCEKAA